MSIYTVLWKTKFVKLVLYKNISDFIEESIQNTIYIWKFQNQERRIFFRKYCICMQLTMIRVQPPGSALCHLLLLPKTAARISSRFSVTDSFLNLPFFDPMVSPSPGCHMRERQGISSVFHHPEPSRQMLPMKQACGIFERRPWTENVQNQLEARTTQHYLSKVAGVCSLQWMHWAA